MFEYELTNLVSNVAFPVFVAVYFIFRMEKTIRNNTQVIQNLKETLDRNLVSSP